MAKITQESRDLFKKKSDPYRDEINELFKKEKDMLNLIAKDSTGVAYKRLVLCEDMLHVASLFMAINNLSVEILDTKNNDALNDAKKNIYKAIIYLEDIVTSQVDVPYKDIEDKVAQFSNMSLEKRFYLVRKLGLAIDLLIESYGENTKWKWSFVELNGRFATVAKNMIDMKAAGKNYFDPNSDEYEDTVTYVRLIKKLLGQSADQYRDKYELSTHRLDDMRLAINYLVAQRRVCIIINEKEEAEEIKKKALVWKDRLDKDQKKGVAR